MSDIRGKLKVLADGNVGFWCPGCKHTHVIAVAVPFRNGATWGFNGNHEAPTFTPSVHCRSGHYVDGTPADQCWLCKKGSVACGVCHSFVTDGRIQFLGDCTHALAGQTVDLPDYPRSES